MESNWAAEHLQTIRTLMERSAVYRRALAPITTFVGVVGIAAAIAGWLAKVESLGAFALYWIVICLVVIAGAFLLVRRQALRTGEPFWSPPTRRVAQAMIPALLVGLVFGMMVAPNTRWMALIWTFFYGLALHSASFFMPRSIRLFGWGLLLVGVVLLIVDLPNTSISPHLLMGVIFGASHLAYGIYLYFTEPRKNET
jgi:hypothetical protein